MSKFSAKKVWSRIFEKPFVCPICGSSKYIIVDLSLDEQYGDVECSRCDHLIYKYTKEEMRKLGYYDLLSEEEKKTIDELRTKWTKHYRIVRKEYQKS